MKRAPVVGNEVARSQSLEEGERIIAREMAAPEAGLPPRSMSDREQREIENTILVMKDALDKVMARRRQAGVARKEARSIRRDQQVHVRGTSPAIEPVTVAAVSSSRCMYRQRAELHGGTGVDPGRLAVARAPQPFTHGSRCVDRNTPGKRRQRREREMVRMGVRDEDRVEIGERVERNPRWTYPSQESGKRWIEVRVGEDALATDLEKERRVTDVRHTHPLDGARFSAAYVVGRGDVAVGAWVRPGTGATFARSFAINHCWGRAAMFCTV